MTFPSPDSVSGTSIQFDGRDASWQLTRATSTPTSYALAVAKFGTGSGFVSSSPTGIDCGATCSASFASGAKVTLSATPAAGSTFAGWSGACTGTGICTVTMGAAKKVTAAFRIRPFTAATSKVIAGNRATISSTITFNPSDVGKPGAVFVTAWVPANALGTLGISVAADSLLSITGSAVNLSLAGAANKLHLTQGPLAEQDTSEFVLVQLTASGWQLVVNGQLFPYASGVLGDQLASQTILNGTDTTNLIGAQFCVGYGTDATDMIATGKVQLIETIPDESATSASSGSCIVNDMIVYLEEPAHGGTASGVGNVRGWAVSLQPIQRMDLYIDGSLAFTVPYGGSRSDVGAAYASYPESTNSGFSMAYNFGLLSAGSHTFLTRAVDNAGMVKDATATFNVVRFPSSFIANAAEVSLVGASATIVDANTLRLDNVMVQGVSYTLSLRWNTATQGFALTAISATQGTTQSVPRIASLADTSPEAMIVNLEEPVHGGTASGVGNVRGWAVSPQPIQRMDLYVDGSLAFTVPYGGSRSDVGAAYASYPESTNSGFSMAYNFGLLSAGSHSFLTRAVDNAGMVKDATATFNVVRFPSSFIANAAEVSLVGASATIIDANTLRLDNVMVQGVSYNLTLSWNTATQGFALVATN